MSKEYLASVVANTAHMAIGHKRKYTGLDYITHPMGVVGILKRHEVFDDDMLSAAWLHDTVEDTGLTLGFIKSVFGQDIHDIVEMLTDVSKPEDGNREIRKAMDREHYKTADYRGMTVKIADCLDNGYDIMVSDPDFAIPYFKEMKLLAPYLERGHNGLYLEILLMIREYENSRVQDALEKMEP